MSAVTPYEAKYAADSWWVEELKALHSAMYHHSVMYGVDPRITAAIVWRESAGRCYAPRYEKGWKWFYKPQEFARMSGVSVATEMVCQQMSWGAMQVMGAVAREMGHTGGLPELVEPDVGIRFGVMKFRSLFDRHKVLTEAVSAYNQGSPRRMGGGAFKNQAYVDVVMKHARQLKKPEGIATYDF